MVTIGIDVGGSITKIVGFDRNSTLIPPQMVRATDPTTSVYGALGKFTSTNGLALADIDNILVTGVGAGHIDLSAGLHGCIPTQVNEFECIGRGGLYLSELNRAIILNMGTGTAVVYADKGGHRHLGGTGVGGGTLMGLSKKLLGMENLENVIAIAEQGELGNVDLRIGDMARPGGLGLPAAMTAANFGKLSDLATKEDTALGLINMVFETAGMIALFASRSYGLKDIVVTGYLSTVPQAQQIFASLSDFFDVNIVIPTMSEYATVIGAALV